MIILKHWKTCHHKIHQYIIKADDVKFWNVLNTMKTLLLEKLITFFNSVYYINLI